MEVIMENMESFLKNNLKNLYGKRRYKQSCKTCKNLGEKFHLYICHIKI